MDVAIGKTEVGRVGRAKAKTMNEQQPSSVMRKDQAIAPPVTQAVGTSATEGARATQEAGARTTQTASARTTDAAKAKTGSRITGARVRHGARAASAQREETFVDAWRNRGHWWRARAVVALVMSFALLLWTPGGSAALYRSGLINAAEAMGFQAVADESASETVAATTDLDSGVTYTSLTAASTALTAGTSDELTMSTQAAGDIYEIPYLFIHPYDDSVYDASGTGAGHQYSKGKLLFDRTSITTSYSFDHKYFSTGPTGEKPYSTDATIGYHYEPGNTFGHWVYVGENGNEFDESDRQGMSRNLATAKTFKDNATTTENLTSPGQGEQDVTLSTYAVPINGAQGSAKYIDQPLNNPFWVMGNTLDMWMLTPTTSRRDHNPEITADPTTAISGTTLYTFENIATRDTLNSNDAKGVHATGLYKPTS